jgi:hypothetical protein
MQQRKRTFIRPLLLALILVIGPVHAQAMMACAAMDMSMSSEHDCDDHKKTSDCLDSGLDTTVDSVDDPCCEPSVELSIDESTRQNTPIVKPAEIHPGVDLIQAIIASFYVIEPPRGAALLGSNQSFPTPSRPGSNTYLITQRLRI